MILLNSINNMDCIIGMQNMKQQKLFANLVLTSPPYNIIRPNSSDRGYDLYKDGMSNEEYCKWTVDIFNHFNDVLVENGCVLYNMSYGTENTEGMSLTVAEIIKNTNFTLADIIVWKKPSATPNNVSPNKLTRIVEFIYVFCRKNEFNTFVSNKKILSERETGQKIYQNVFNFITAANNDGPCDLNKATFSTELCYKLFNLYAKPNSTILDIFGGSGTTAEAALKARHNYILFELSEQQCDYAEKRLIKVKNQSSLFDLFE